MAQNTVLNFTLQAKDWETIIGIVDNSAENDIRSLKSALISYYVANGNPQNNTNITISLKEKTLVKIFKYIYGTTTSYVYNDTGANSINRIVTAIRAANNIADNYISTQLSAEDVIRDAKQVTIRKAGREIIMMETFDNN